MENVLYWLWMADVLGIASPSAGLALKRYGDARSFYTQVRAGLWPDFLSRAALTRARRLEPGDLSERLADCEAIGAAILTPEDPDYPHRLRDLPDLPLVLYVTGRTDCLNGRRYVSMVGTRRPTPYGRRACGEISRPLAEQGIVLISGLADGLDGEAHKAAVDCGMETIAFLGTAIDKTDPAANAPLRADIERLGGAVVSEYHPGFSGKMQGTFLMRNRLIAGMGEALCVCEASLRSGTINTVGHAERYGRPVMAVPGSIFSRTSEGTNALLADGRAHILRSAGDVCRVLGLAPEDDLWQNDPGDSNFSDLSPIAQKVLGVLGPDPMYLEDICRAAQLPAAQVLAAYTELELAGAAVPGPGRSLAAAR